jgi:Ser-tRNA(Ala) deacylase AlaX
MTVPPAYQRSPFTSELDVEVLASGESLGEAWIETSDTIIYPGGGGQPADQGTVAGVPVTAVQRTERGWRHQLARSPAQAAASGAVGVAINWARRFDHMQQHTAQHVLSALAQDRWGWATTAFHLGAERSDVELDTPAIPPAQLAALEEAVMTVVRDALPVSTRYVSVAEYQALGTRSRGLPEGHAGDVRLVTIEGLDVNACGGTHLTSTAQIEALKLVGTEPMRGGTRLHWVAGGRLRARLGAHEVRSEELRKLLGAPDPELVAQAAAKLEQLRSVERRAQWTLARLAEETAARLTLTGQPVLEAHFDGLDAAFLKAVALRLQDTLGERAALLTSEVDGARAFVLVAGPTAALEVRTAGQKLAELFEGRGGGTGRIFQGRAGSWAGRDEVMKVLGEL